jgi:hypothetical protein
VARRFSVLTDTTIIVSPKKRKVAEEARKFTYKLTFRTFKTMFMDFVENTVK